MIRDPHKYIAYQRFTEDLLRIFNNTCACCGRRVYKKKDIKKNKISDYGLMYAIDHIKPWNVCDESTHSVLNLQVLCSTCNVQKGNKEYSSFFKKKNNF